MKLNREEKKYLTLCLSVSLLLLLPLLLVDCSTLLSSISKADAHEHKYTPTLENGHLTICRLKKVEKAHQNANGQDGISWWCLYEGANGSGFLELVDSYKLCPKQVVCEYDPKDKPPSIDDMLQAMKDAFN